MDNFHYELLPLPEILVDAVKYLSPFLTHREQSEGKKTPYIWAMPSCRLYIVMKKSDESEKSCPIQ